jgi:hypothetical protein
MTKLDRNIFWNAINSKKLQQQYFVNDITHLQVWNYIMHQTKKLTKGQSYRINTYWTPDLLIMGIACIIKDVVLTVESKSDGKIRGFRKDLVIPDTPVFNRSLLQNLQFTNYVIDKTSGKRYYYKDILRSIRLLKPTLESETLPTTFGGQQDLISEFVVLIACFLYGSLSLSDSTGSLNNGVLVQSNTCRASVKCLQLLVFQRNNRKNWRIPFSGKHKSLLFDGANVLAQAKTSHGKLCIVRVFPMPNQDLFIAHQLRPKIRDAIRYEPLLHYHHLSRQECIQETSIDLPLNSLSVILSSIIVVSRRYPILLHSYHKQRDTHNQNWLQIKDSRDRNISLTPTHSCLSKMTVLIDKAHHTCKLYCCYNLVITHLFPILEKIRRQMVDLVIEGTDQVTEETVLPIIKPLSYQIDPWVLCITIRTYLRLLVLYLIQLCTGEDTQVDYPVEVDICLANTDVDTCIQKIVQSCTLNDQSLPVICWQTKTHPRVYIGDCEGGDTFTAYLFVILSHFVRNKLPTWVVQDLLIHICIVKSQSGESGPWLRDVDMSRDANCMSRQRLVVYTKNNSICVKGMVLPEVADKLHALI